MPEKVPGTRTKKQTIVIYWNFIGAVEIPDEQEKVVVILEQIAALLLSELNRQGIVKGSDTFLELYSAEAAAGASGT